MSFWGKLEKVAKWSLASPLIAAVSFQLTQSYAYHKKWDTPIRNEFANQYSMQIGGWPQDVESNPAVISDLADVVAREVIEHPAEIGAINIIGQDWRRRDLVDNIIKYIEPSSPGYYNPFMKTINLFQGSFKKIDARFYFKQAKLAEALKKDPMLINRWQEQGPPQFDWENKITAPQTLHVSMSVPILPENYPEPEEYPNPEEYTAEKPVTDKVIENRMITLATIAEEYAEIPERMYILLHPQVKGRSVPNDVLINNLELIQDAGLIPKEFLDHVYLSKHGYNAYHAGNPEYCAKYLNASNYFFTLHPNSIYASEIRLTRSAVMNKLYRIALRSPTAANPFAIEELKKALLENYKEKNNHQLILGNMGATYAALHDAKSQKVMGDASLLFLQRYWAGSATLSSMGVNDYLRQQGILK